MRESPEALLRFVAKVRSFRPGAVSVRAGQALTRAEMAGLFARDFETQRPMRRHRKPNAAGHAVMATAKD